MAANAHAFDTGEGSCNIRLIGLHPTQSRTLRIQRVQAGATCGRRIQRPPVVETQTPQEFRYGGSKRSQRPVRVRSAEAAAELAWMPTAMTKAARPVRRYIWRKARNSFLD
jgi:hypothetical protein